MAMLKKIFLLMLLWPALVYTVRAQESDSLKLAYDLAKQGLELVDKGKLDEALVAFNQGALMDPSNSNFQYEIALVYYLKKDHQRTIEILEKAKLAPDANDQYYQILGNAYDLSGQTAKARKTYAEGIKKFPQSGVLFLEAGVLEYVHKNSDDAVRFWESGIIANPGFTSNYYWLAKYYASTSEKVWGALYAEMFINLERNTDRTKELSDLIYKIYKSSVVPNDSGGYTVGFTKSIVVNTANAGKLPFEHVFRETMVLAADSLSRSGSDSLSYEELCTLRGLFMFYWYNTGNAGNYPNVLFDWIHALPEPFYLDCYHHWLFLKGNEDAFTSWYYARPDDYGTFVKWFKRNPVKISRTTFLSRSLY